MGKHDHPTLQMQVQSGRLVPLTPYEAEVLSTYSNGAVLTVDMNQKRSLPLLKKYWAVLRDVVSNCKTPWNSPDEASDALKLALGVTDVGKTVSGQWFIRAGSISFTSMDQAAFKDFFDQAMAVLAEVTGIDPDELSSRYRHIPEQETSDAPLSSGEGTSEPTAQAQLGGADLSADEADSDEAGEHEAAGSQSAAPASSLDPVKRMLMEECIDNMLRDAMSEPAIERPAKVDKLRDVFLEPQNLGDFADFVNRCHETARRIIGKPAEKDRARDYLIGKVPS